MCGSERIDNRLVEEGLLWMPTLDEIAGKVARRVSCMSWRPAFIVLGEKRAAMAFNVFCVARNVSNGAPMLPSELWRESAGAAIRGTAIVEHPIWLMCVSTCFNWSKLGLPELCSASS